ELTLTPGTPVGNQVPVTVTATLIDNIPDHSNLSTDNITITGIVVQGTDGTTPVQGTVEVAVVDDVPVAIDNDAIIDENGVSFGNVLDNDIQGADGATLTKVTFGDPADYGTFVEIVTGTDLGGGAYKF